MAAAEKWGQNKTENLSKGVTAANPFILYISGCFFAEIFFSTLRENNEIIFCSEKCSKVEKFRLSNRKINHLEVSFHFLHFFKKKGNPYYKYISLKTIFCWQIQ